MNIGRVDERNRHGERLSVVIDQALVEGRGAAWTVALRLEQAPKDESLVNGRTFGSTLVTVNQFGVVSTQGVKDRGMDIVDVQPVSMA